jgi:mRNA-decapping enzyme subunit 2
MELEEAPPPISLADAFDELHARFLNLSETEIPTVETVFYHIQQAHWFYEDEWADQFDTGGASSGDEHISQRPVLPHLRFDAFSKEMFAHSPMLQKYCENHADFKARFKEYSNQIPRYGVILLNRTATHVLLIAGMNSKTFGFPKGKVNIGEAGIDCAAREAYEETGYNSRHLLTEAASITHASPDGGFSKLYIAVGVPDDSSFIFAPITRKEVGGIAWVEMATIQNHEGLSPEQDGSYKKVKLWGVTEYLGQIRSALDRSKTKAKKMKEKKNKANIGGGGGGKGGSTQKQQQQQVISIHQKSVSTPSSKHLPHSHPHSSGSSGGHLLEDPLQREKSWSAKEMFKKNEALLGTKFVYDGNPHTFGEEVVVGSQTPRKNDGIIGVKSIGGEGGGGGGGISTVGGGGGGGGKSAAEGGGGGGKASNQKAKKKKMTMNETKVPLTTPHAEDSTETDEPHINASDSDTGFTISVAPASSASGEGFSDSSARSIGGGGGGINSLAEPFRFDRKAILDSLLT